MAALDLQREGYPILLQLSDRSHTKREQFQELFMQAIHIIILRPCLPLEAIYTDTFKEQDFLLLLCYICHIFFSIFGSLAFALPSEWGIVLKHPLHLYNAGTDRRPLWYRVSSAIRSDGASGIASLMNGLSNAASSLGVDNTRMVSCDHTPVSLLTNSIC